MSDICYAIFKEDSFGYVDLIALYRDENKTTIKCNELKASSPHWTYTEYTVEQLEIE